MIRTVLNKELFSIMPYAQQPATAEERSVQLVEALKRAGLRLTPQRTAICHCLAHDKTHPTAQALYETIKLDFPNISRATIYNTLETLEKAGLIYELGAAGDNAVHYDADSSPHVNVVCTNCHRIDDYPAAVLAGVAKKVTNDLGYDIRGARVVYYGLCPKCRRARKTG
jgi:Fur family transcriptional regulator, peroxide stress response regulator